MATGKKLPNLESSAGRVVYVDYRSGLRVEPHQDFSIKHERFNNRVNAIAHDLGFPSPMGH